jgi:very-short-patch-repair endonuclease
VTEGGIKPKFGRPTLPSHFEVSKRNRTNARSMRKQMTDAELKLWNELRAHRLMGLSFRRQYPIGHYIVDFACPQYAIIIEVDGAQHNEAEAQAYDQKRSTFLSQSGWAVVRFTNDDVIKDIEGVCQHITIIASQKGLQ